MKKEKRKFRKEETKMIYQLSHMNTNGQYYSNTIKTWHVDAITGLPSLSVSFRYHVIYIIYI